ncbi:hypothetical protein HK096_006271, partial [Nowakowskiella sp. JEL0078]
ADEISKKKITEFASTFVGLPTLELTILQATTTNLYSLDSGFKVLSSVDFSETHFKFKQRSTKYESSSRKHTREYYTGEDTHLRHKMFRRNSCAPVVGGSTYLISDVYGNSTAHSPGIVVGSLVFQTATGSAKCTATFIDKNHILTAAHCVYGGGKWYKEWIFYPGHDNGKNPLGSFNWKTVTIFDAWTKGYGNSSTSNFEGMSYDMAIIELDGGVGTYMDFGYKDTWGGDALTVWGYPYNVPDRLVAAIGSYSTVYDINFLQTNVPGCSGDSGSAAWYDPSILYGVLSFYSGNYMYMNFMTKRKGY